MSKVSIQCQCGQSFQTSQHLLNVGRGKYCSKKCMYEYRPPAVRTKYTKRKENAGWFRKGVNSFPENKIQKGQTISPDTQFKKGSKPSNFKGDDVGYGALHQWVRYHKGKPDKCEQCGSLEDLNWANKSHEYNRDINDWMPLCQSCHMKYDRANGWGAATRKYKSLQK